MSVRVAVVAASHGEPWREEHLVVRRLCGALACEADVDLLVGEGPAGDSADGAVRVRRFGAPVSGHERRLAVRRALLGPQPADDPVSCGCTAAVRRRRAGELATRAQELLLAAEGERAVALEQHLALTGDDVVVLAGLSATTVGAMAAVGGRRPCVLVPLARDDEVLWTDLAGNLLRQADRILVAGDHEAALVRRRLPDLGPGVLITVGFVVRPHEMAHASPPLWWDGRPTLVFARDWAASPPGPRLRRSLGGLRRHFGPAVAVRGVGPGVMALPRGMRVDYATSRTDAWRWMAHAVAVVDGDAQRVLGREVLESMLLGTPVVVTADGGATRAHAEAGGGLWYRTDAELVACAEALVGDHRLRSTLGAQGLRYAAGAYGDPDRFVERVSEAVLGLAA